MRKYNYIYKITNLINDKIYIGKHSTDNLDDGYMGSGRIINSAIHKYGLENFTKEYLAFCDTEEKLNWFEKFYIKKYHSHINEGNYNLTDGGDGGNTYKYKSIDELNEIKKKISKSKEGERNPMYGKHFSEESKQKISESLRGKMNPMYGKHHSAETRRKMSESKKGKKVKPQIKNKWLTPTGEIIEMHVSHVKQWHTDWKLIQ